MFEVEIFLNDLDPNDVRVELYADGIDGGDPVREEMKYARPLPDASRLCVYHATVPAARQAGDYTARVIPRRSGWRSRWNALESCGSDDEIDRRKYDEESDCDHLHICGYRRRPAH